MTQQAFLPIHTVSEANYRDRPRFARGRLRRSWEVKADRVKDQRGTTTLLCRGYFRRPGLPVAITLVRIGFGSLDDDNLCGALKAVRDGVADFLGVDDADPRVRWRYGQERGLAGSFGVLVVIDEVRG